MKSPLLFCLTALLVILFAFPLPGLAQGTSNGTTPNNAPSGTVPNNTPNGTTPPNTPNGTTPPNTPNGTTPLEGGIVNPLKDIDSLPELLEVVLDAIVQLGTIILTLALVYVGFLFVVAQGNEEKITNAKNALLWTVIGGLILLGASAIGAVIGSTVDTFTQ